MRTFLLASLRTHARRYIAVAVAVLVATTFMVATNALGSAARDGWHDTIASEFEGADAVLTDVGTRTASRVAALDGVEAVGAGDLTYLRITAGDTSRVGSIGTVADDDSLRWQELERGEFPGDPREVLIGSDAASEAGVDVGDAVAVDTGKTTLRLTVAGVAEPSDGDLGASVYLPERTMADVRGDAPPPRLVVGLGDASAGTLDDVRAAAPAATVQSVDAYVHQAQVAATGDVDVLQQTMFVFVSIALLVAALVIANTLGIVLAQRVRDFALLRCVGAMRRQIVRSVLAETLVVTAVAALAGVPAGLGVAYGGAALLGDVAPGVALATPSTTVLGAAGPVLVAVGVALAASLVPARRMNKLSPLAALRPEPDATPRTGPGRLRLALATVLVTSGVAGLVTGASAGLLPVAVVGGAVSFVGVLLLAPIVVPAAIGAVRPLAGRVAGVPGRLAAANAVRHRRRTGATSAALLIGVTLIATVIVGTASMKASMDTELDTRSPVDLVLDGDRPLGDDLAERAASTDGVAEAAEISGGPVRLGGAPMVAVGVDADAASVARPEGGLRDVGPNEVHVPVDAGFGDGERVEVAGPDGTTRLDVVTGSRFGSKAVVSTATLEDLGVSTKPYAVWLRADDGADAGALAGELNALAEGENVTVDGSLPERAAVMSALDVVLAITVGLLGVAVLIAVVGVGNTLSLSVLERARENALLRALGLRRSQQRSMLAVEALLVSGVAGVLGIGLGLAYAWFGVRTVAAEQFVTTPGLEIPVGQLAAVLGCAAVAGLLASVLPARRAVRVPPAAGLAAD